MLMVLPLAETVVAPRSSDPLSKSMSSVTTADNGVLNSMTRISEAKAIAGV